VRDREGLEGILRMRAVLAFRASRSTPRCATSTPSWQGAEQRVPSDATLQSALTYARPGHRHA
jgi:hypothetical protein